LSATMILLRTGFTILAGNRRGNAGD
jgi:hypothetical protein